jgi:4-aminobutyrate aminotransferase-like enzyme
LANIEFLERQKLADGSLKKGELLKARFEHLKGKNKLMGEIRGKGLMLGIELVRDDQKTPANSEANKIRDFCCERGLLIGLGGVDGNVLRIQPPLVISNDQLEEVVKVFDLAFNRI